MASVDISWPEISVVIPVYNEADRLQEVLRALQGQDYPSNFYEVIVVDNGSTDRSPEVARSMKDVRLLFETEQLGSPYSARNRGIEAASGAVIALVDSVCRPVYHWLRSGIETMCHNDGDLLGGNVEFEYGNDVTSGKIFDALSNVKMKEYVEERGVATTGNLFVRREVFETRGLFPEGVRSGGDLRWTKGATQSGWKLVYGPQATVYYPARSLGPLLRKQFRVAKGQPNIWREAGAGSVPMRILKHLLKPIPVQRVKDKIERRGEAFMYDYLWQVWLVHYAVKIVMTAGRVYGSLSSTVND